MRPFPLSTALRLLLVLLQTAVTGFPDSPWKQANGGRFQALAPALGGTVGKTGFTTLPTAATGLAFTNTLDAQAAANNRILEKGSGIALGDVDGDGLCDIYLCRLQGPNGLFLNRGSWRFEPVPGAGGAACASDASTGAVMADVDGDRDLDLLVNGLGTGTRLFLNDSRGGFTESTNNRLSRRLGATSLALADLDGDGRDELVLATEFGPLRFLRRSEDGISAWDPELRFTDAARKPARSSALSGFWNGVTAADIDGDGRIDLAAGNWGWNFGEARIDPRRDRVTVVHGEFGLGTGVHPVLASTDPAQGIPLPWREWTQIRNALPFILEKAPDHATYGRTSVEALLGAHAAEAARLDADWFASSVFLNRGDHFLVRPLPAEAQWTPAFGISAADFDGDGHTDLFLTQNHFGSDAETSRQDAGLGLVLIGDGKGAFRTLGPNESGVRMTGEGRGSAVLDFDRDGRMDIVAVQAEGPAKLYRNRSASSGWTVSLRGRRENPAGIGAVVRFESSGAAGAALPGRAGSGWWSQDSPRVLLTGGKPEAVRVRWPGGRETRTPWPGNRRE